MLNQKTRIKAAISYIIVALLFVFILLGSIQIVFGSQVSEAISLINMISIDTNNIKEEKEIKINTEKKRLQSYPEYGTKYGNIKIESLNVDLPLYYGDTLDILRKGVGQSSGGYFPGEGDSIKCMAHNTKGFLRELQNIKIGAIIEIDTSYGNFKYEVYNTKIIHQTDLAALPTHSPEETLMLYTCYPTNSIGHATHRFVTYSKLVQEEVK